MIGGNTLEGLILLFERKQRRSGSGGEEEWKAGLGGVERVETVQDAM